VGTLERAHKEADGSRPLAGKRTFTGRSRRQDRPKDLRVGSDYERGRGEKKSRGANVREGAESMLLKSVSDTPPTATGR